MVTPGSMVCVLYGRALKGIGSSLKQIFSPPYSAWRAQGGRWRSGPGQPDDLGIASSVFGFHAFNADQHQRMRRDFLKVEFLPQLDVDLAQLHLDARQGLCRFRLGCRIGPLEFVAVHRRSSSSPIGGRTTIKTTIRTHAHQLVGCDVCRGVEKRSTPILRIP